MKTILITGCSSGFGLATAEYFLARDWRVIATMRTPRVDVLPRSEHVRVLPLDVTDTASIRKVAEAAGPIDVLVNNAGSGIMGPFEGIPMDVVRATFETNTFGAMAVTQAFIAQLREQKDGVIVNISSSTTLKSHPLITAYTAAKAALNAFTECLALELEPFNVRVRLVLPGQGPETAFRENGLANMKKLGAPLPAYGDFLRRTMERLTTPSSTPLTKNSDVTEAIWRAATDPACPLRQPAGADAIAWAGDAASTRG